MSQRPSLQGQEVTFDEEEEHKDNRKDDAVASQNNNAAHSTSDLSLSQENDASANSRATDTVDSSTDDAALIAEASLIVGDIITFSIEKCKSQVEESKDVDREAIVDHDTAGVNNDASEAREELPGQDNVGNQAEFHLESSNTSVETSTERSVEFRIKPSEQVFSMTVDVFHTILQLKELLAQEIKVSIESINVLFKGNPMSNASTLLELNVALEEQIQFDVILGDFHSAGIDLNTNRIIVSFRKESGDTEMLVVEIERCKRRKPFLGGYRHKLTGVEYHNASSQTNREQRLYSNENKRSRDTQTVTVSNGTTQTSITTSTQVTTPGYYSSECQSRRVASKPYVNSEEYLKKKLKAIITIQSHYRRWQAQLLFGKLKSDVSHNQLLHRLENVKKARDKEARVEELLRRRLEPTTKEDFDLVYSVLKRWRMDETEHINRELDGVERKAALYCLLLREGQYIGTIESKKADVLQRAKLKRRLSALQELSKPKTWCLGDGRKIAVETSSVQQASEMMNIYKTLNTLYFTVGERIDALRSVKATVQANPCPMVEELMKLIDREVDMLRRGTAVDLLDGLRKRMSTLLYFYCKTPAFNPEAVRLQKTTDLDQRAMIYCSSHGHYLTINDFDFRTRTKVEKLCKKDHNLQNISNKRLYDLQYTVMLDKLKVKEKMYGNSIVVYFLKKDDVKYIVENIWSGKSIYSGSSDPYDLVLVRWVKDEEWAPWNCILLAENEVESHLGIDDVNEAYSEDFIDKVTTKHARARVCFSKIADLAQMMRRNLDVETDGLKAIRSTTTSMAVFNSSSI